MSDLLSDLKRNYIPKLIYYFRYCIVFTVSKAAKACLENKDTWELRKGNVFIFIDHKDVRYKVFYTNNI